MSRFNNKADSPCNLREVLEKKNPIVMTRTVKNPIILTKLKKNPVILKRNF